MLLIVRGLVVVTLMASTAVAGPGLFDAPLHKVTVRLPPDPANPQANSRRTCSFYRAFMVREVDTGQVGADELAVVPADAKGCGEKTLGEHIVNPNDWSGYFAGVKGAYVFFDAEDGHNGGMPFAVYSGRTGRKLFDDSRKGPFHSIRLTPDGMVLRYRRVYDAHCSLISGRGCWEAIEAATKLTREPDCRGAYAAEKKRAPEYAPDIPRVPSVIAYDVEARVAGAKVTYSVRSGKIECWLED